MGATMPSIGLWVVLIQGSLSATSFVQLQILLSFFQRQTLRFQLVLRKLLGKLLILNKKNAIRRLAVLSLAHCFFFVCVSPSQHVWYTLIINCLHNLPNGISSPRFTCTLWSCK